MSTREIILSVKTRSGAVSQVNDFAQIAPFSTKRRHGYIYILLTTFVKWKPAQLGIRTPESVSVIDPTEKGRAISAKMRPGHRFILLNINHIDDITGNLPRSRYRPRSAGGRCSRKTERIVLTVQP